MRIEDIPHLVQIDEKSNHPSWTAGMFERELNLPFSYTVVAEHDDSADHKTSIVGFGIAWVLGEIAQINQLAVVPEQRRSGVGQALLSHILNHCRQKRCMKIELELKDGNLPAQSLYEKMGFGIVGRRKQFYPDGDAVLMECRLS